MKFLTIYTPANRTPGPPSAEHMARMGRLIEEQTKAGVLVATGGLFPSTVRMQRNGDEIFVTDGPFTESKGDGVNEIHQIVG